MAQIKAQFDGRIVLSKVSSFAVRNVIWKQTEGSKAVKEGKAEALFTVKDGKYSLITES